MEIIDNNTVRFIYKFKPYCFKCAENTTYCRFTSMDHKNDVAIKQICSGQWFTRSRVSSSKNKWVDQLNDDFQAMLEQAYKKLQEHWADNILLGHSNEDS